MNHFLNDDLYNNPKMVIQGYKNICGILDNLDKNITIYIKEHPEKAVLIAGITKCDLLRPKDIIRNAVNEIRHGKVYEVPKVAEAFSLIFMTKNALE